MRRAVLLLAPLLMGAECDPPEPTAPAREVGIELHDGGPQRQGQRSQDAGTLRWDGTSRLHFIGMEAPVSVEELRVVDGATGFPPPGQPCVFWDAVDPLRDAGVKADSVSSFSLSLLPGEYDVLVAPDCLVGSFAATRFEGESVAPGAASYVFELPAREPVSGRVVTTSGDSVEGAVVSVFPADRPEDPLGVTATTGVDGSFALQVPPGQYTVVASTPAGGLLPGGGAIAPKRLSPVTLPLPAGFDLLVRVPSLPTTPVRGALEERTGTLTAGRIRVEGFIAPIPLGDIDYEGGFFRAEFVSDDGTWEVRLPPGDYEAIAWPPHAGGQRDPATGLLPIQDQDTARLAFAVEAAQPLEDLRLRYTDSTLVQVQVREPGGGPAAGSVSFRMDSAPHYQYRYPLPESGDLSLLLMADTYRVEVLPAKDEDGSKRFARAHGTLDLTQGPASLALTLPPSDPYQARVLEPDGSGVGDLRIVVRDAETGEIVDDSLTAPAGVVGFYQGVLPR